eukprot:Em0011g490a
MMKHSMSGISDEQIDDFLNGKCPLSVAIRVGESVVVVNLHRAKVEEIAVEPPPHIAVRAVGRVREGKTPDNGISVKRKAVMEAISEILKKMYANSDKGRLPGSFRGRFSSEFTCDNDMREILHSKTTMTGYGTEDDERLELVDQQCLGGSIPLGDNSTSKAKNEENEQLRNKVASLKWKMQKTRAIKKAKRMGKSPCGWMESLNCDMPLESPMVQEQTGFCGMKRGFLLAD